ncbi:MAG TPA: ParB/RepB/Spo0J family partition protein [Fibrobacteria bacterium]|nr:ParB/RepB/Spo0J family partition protein [Fibrobacteria bacterium]
MSTVAPAKAAPIKNKIVDLNLSDIIPTKDNTRSFEGWEKNPALLRMAENIRQKGILQPILVRKHPTKAGKYDLRAGERRFRASKLAGLKTIPALVLLLSDEDAQEVTLCAASLVVQGGEG